MMRLGRCDDYGLTTQSLGGWPLGFRTPEFWHPVEETISTDIYRETVRRSSDRFVSYPVQPVSGKTMMSTYVKDEKRPFGVCEDTSVIHIEPVKRFSITAKVLSVKKGTINHIDQTTIEL